MSVFRQSLYFTEQQVQAAKRALGRLAGLDGVNVAVAIDYRGVPLVHIKRGNWQENVKVSELATLVAAQMAAMESTARLLGETGYHEVFQSGRGLGLLLRRIVPGKGSEFEDDKRARGTLLVLFDAQKPTGPLRAEAHKVTDELSAIFVEAAKNEVPEEVPDFDRDQTVRALEDLFNSEGNG